MCMLLYYSDISLSQLSEGFINIKDMYKMTVGRVGVRVYEAHEVKSRLTLVRVPFYFINFACVE